MPVSETPDAAKLPEGGGSPAGKSLSRALGAATESGKDAYNKGSAADHDGGGGAELNQKRKEQEPKSVLED